MSKKGGKGQTKEIKDQSYNVRDVVLAKIRGYPPWPGMVRPPRIPFTRLRRLQTSFSPFA